MIPNQPTKNNLLQGFNFYVYLITDLDPIGTERYYIGSSYRKELQENNINPEEDTYFGSSSNPHLRALQRTQSIQLERIIIKTFSTNIDCLTYEEAIQRGHEAASNPLFYNKGYANMGFCNSPETLKKIVSDRRQDIDESGLDSYQRASIKGVKVKKMNVDDNGLDTYQRSSIKSIATKKNDIDENGLDGCQRVIQKKLDTMRMDVDENGLDGCQRAVFKGVNTKLQDVDVNGFNTFQRASVKGIKAKRLNIDDNGFNTFQRASIKGNESKRLNIDDSGLNECQRAMNKRLDTMQSNIDENGLNGNQRVARKRNAHLGMICHNDYGCFHFAHELADILPLLKITVINSLRKNYFNVVITTKSYNMNKYLKSLGCKDDIVGLTWNDLGFYVKDEINNRKEPKNEITE
jgi:hypothetical protein